MGFPVPQALLLKWLKSITSTAPEMMIGLDLCKVKEMMNDDNQTPKPCSSGLGPDHPFTSEIHGAPESRRAESLKPRSPSDSLNLTPIIAKLPNCHSSTNSELNSFQSRIERTLDQKHFTVFTFSHFFCTHLDTPVSQSTVATAANHKRVRHNPVSKLIETWARDGLFFLKSGAKF